MEQNLENTEKLINEINTLMISDNLFEKIDKYDDSYNSTTLKYYEKTITKYANQSKSNELISFKLLKENHYLVHELISNILKSLENNDFNENILLNLINTNSNEKQLPQQTNEEDIRNDIIVDDTDEEDTYEEDEEDEEDEEKIKGFNQKEHLAELKKIKLTKLVSFILDKKVIITNYKDKIIYSGYGLINDKEVIIKNDIYNLEENEYKSKTKKLFFTYENNNNKNSIKKQKEKLKIYSDKFRGSKYIMDRDFELIGLIEYVYIYKYERLIKKEIYQQIKNRFFVGKSTYNPMQDPNLFERLKDEAISYATEGFLIGMRKYSTNSKTKLITYVTWWIKQRIVYYIENFSSINKGKKTISNEESFEIERDEETGKIKFNKYANIKFENYNFVKSDDIGKYEELEKLQKNGDIFSRHDGKIYDILTFFCRHNDIFLPFEYLLIKYDILLEEYIYYIDIAKDEEIRTCFYKQIIEVNNILKSKGYEDIMDFEGIKRYDKLRATLMIYFNIEKQDYLTIKRILKQKLINILKNVFLEKKKRKKKGE